MNVVILVTNETDLTWVRKMFPKVDSIFFVENGPGPLQGRRINNAYVDYMCYKDPNYEACIQQIQSNIKLTTDSGNIFLF